MVKDLKKRRKQKTMSVIFLEEFIPAHLKDGQLSRVVVKKNTKKFIRRVTEETFYYVIGFYIYKRFVTYLESQCGCFEGARGCQYCIRIMQVRYGNEGLTRQELHETFAELDIGTCLESAQIGPRSDKVQLSLLSSLDWNTPSNIILTETRLYPYLRGESNDQQATNRYFSELLHINGKN